MKRSLFLLFVAFPLERKSEMFEECECLVLIARGRDDGDGHAEDVLEVFIGSLREDGVFLDAEGVVTHSVDRGAGEAAEVLGARKSDVDEAVEEFGHALAAEGDLVADRVAFAGLERSDGLLGGADSCLLAGDLCEPVGDELDLALVLNGAEAARNDDLHELGSLHRVLDAELGVKCLE